ncbi:hypothetical protein CTheo_7697 [Ceratobasidium theobromae]|uniref:SHSP domain-containing protein n=1 Tax=Ceratobasidium theobromae TaxID=1582974 RepID=A0A5N5QAT7_9AGAM|nr:hypothetical protein CTheo_7697 [Ceratobasidium theobromae]
MNKSSIYPPISGFSSTILAASLNGKIDIKNMGLSAVSPPTNLRSMDITPGGLGESCAPMNTSPAQSANVSPPDSTFSAVPTGSTWPSSGQQSDSSLVKPQFASNIVPPTPNSPTRPVTRPQLTSRLSSRSGGKRHASIGSARELPFPADPSQPIENPTPGWNARLRDMGLHIPGIGSPRTPKSPRSGSMSSGAATPKSPEDQRAQSYFSFRRRGSGSVASPGKAKGSAATPPPPPSAPCTSQSHPLQDVKRPPPPKDKVMPSPIAEESASLPARRIRANLSLDLSSPLATRGSTASLPLLGHTPVEHLVQGESKPRRASMVAPPAPPPHVHTPPVHPPAYEYPFLPHHAPRQPLEVRVEENPPGQGAGDAGSWVISVRLPGFSPDGITVGTRRGRVLMLVADNYNDDDGAGHFERRISFGYDADMAAIRAEFNGDLLRITVPRRWMFAPPMMAPRNTLGGMTRPTVEDPSEAR